MKIRSLLLGSVAAAGLSTGAFAADLGVLTSLDVCDALGLSGLTISSDTNCLQISGSVSYEFNWGDYAPGVTLVTTGAGGFTVNAPGVSAVDPGANLDWASKVEAWVKFVGTADSDFGPASVVLKIKQVQQRVATNESVALGGDDTAFIGFDEAYVSVGDSTVIMAGKKGSIMKLGEDEPLNFLGLFNSEKVDKGVKWSGGVGGVPDGGHVIQVVSDLGNGISLGAGLENLQAIQVPVSIGKAGTAVGVISYAGDGIAAHLTLAGAGFLDGSLENWGYHAGFAGSFDILKVVGAIAGDNTGYWNGIASASAGFDIFTLAASVEAVNVTTAQQATAGLDTGFGASIAATVTDGVSINFGGRWYRDASNATPFDAYQVAAQLVAAVTESITVTGEVGAYANNAAAPISVYYGAGTVAWAPGGGFTSSVKGEVYSNGAYKATFKAAKTFE